MPVAPRRDRRLQTGRPGADHHHRSRFGGDPRQPDTLGLAAGARVLDAAEPAVEAHPADALLVARQAQTGLVGGAGPGLGREVGVGDLPAHHPDEIAVALGERPFDLQRILEATDADHRQVDRLADGRGDEHRVPRRDVHRRLDHEQARRGDADRGVDVVDVAGRVDDLGHADRVVDRGAVLDQLVAAQPHAERQPVPDHLAHGGDDVDEDARPVLERPAVLVGAAVGGGGEEPADDRAVRALQLDAVEAALGAVLGHQCVAGDDLVDLGARHGLRHLAEQRVGDRRRPPHRQARVHRRRLATVVVDLGEDRRAMAVDRVGDGAVAGDHVAVESVDELLVRPVGRMGRVLLGDDQPGAARRPRRVVRGVLLGRLAVAGVVGEVRREHDPVPRHDGAELQRGPEVAEGHTVFDGSARSRFGLMSVIAPGNVAVITGGASGIGLALAERFIAEGMRVVLADIDAPKLRDVEARLTEAGADVATTVCDTAAEAAVNELAEFTIERFGAAHVLCNNAGIAGVGDAWRDPIELWERVIGINLYGVIHGIRAFLPIMEQQGAGHIVNTASMAGLTALPGAAPYNVTKSGVVALSEGLYLEFVATGSPLRVERALPRLRQDRSDGEGAR